MQGKAAAQRALFATILRSPTRIDDDSPAKWMALGAYAELLLSAQDGRRARSATAHAEDLLAAIVDVVPGSTRKDPSVAFNNGMLRAMRCGEGAHPRIWQHVICVLPLVEGRAKRGGAALYTFPTDPFGQYEAAEDSSDQKMEASEAAVVSGDPSVGVVVALGDEGACDNAADDIEDVEWASDDDADAWVGSVKSRSDDSDCAEDDSSVPDVARPRVRTRSSAPSPSEGRYEKQRRVLVRVRLKRPVQVVL